MPACFTCGREAEAEVNGRPYCHVGTSPTHYQLALYDEAAMQPGDQPTSTWMRALREMYLGEED